MQSNRVNGQRGLWFEQRQRDAAITTGLPAGALIVVPADGVRSQGFQP
jgi:hypothetical protein